MKFIKSTINNKPIYTLQQGNLLISIHNYGHFRYLGRNFEACYKLTLWFINICYWNNDWIEKSINTKSEP